MNDLTYPIFHVSSYALIMIVTLGVAFYNSARLFWVSWPCVVSLMDDGKVRWIEGWDRRKFTTLFFLYMIPIVLGACLRLIGARLSDLSFREFLFIFGFEVFTLAVVERSCKHSFKPLRPMREFFDSEYSNGLYKMDMDRDFKTDSGQKQGKY